jgi:hypothetical protein
VRNFFILNLLLNVIGLVKELNLLPISFNLNVADELTVVFMDQRGPPDVFLFSYPGG